MWAKLTNNLVTFITSVDPNGIVDDASMYVQCFDDTQLGYSYNSADGRFIPPAINPNTAIYRQIANIELLQTTRLIRDVALGNTTVIDKPGSSINGMTPSDALSYIETTAEALRGQLT